MKVTFSMVVTLLLVNSQANAQRWRGTNTSGTSSEIFRLGITGIGPGITSRNDIQAMLHVNGTVRFDDLATSTTENTVLVIDGDGDLLEREITDMGDDLGDHIATENVRLNGNRLTNDGGLSDGLAIDNAGNVTLNQAFNVTGVSDLNGNVRVHSNLFMLNIAPAMGITRALVLAPNNQFVTTSTLGPDASGNRFNFLTVPPVNNTSYVTHWDGAKFRPSTLVVTEGANGGSADDRLGVAIPNGQVPQATLDVRGDAIFSGNVTATDIAASDITATGDVAGNDLTLTGGLTVGNGVTFQNVGTTTSLDSALFITAGGNVSQRQLNAVAFNGEADPRILSTTLNRVPFLDPATGNLGLNDGSMFDYTRAVTNAIGTLHPGGAIAICPPGTPPRGFAPGTGFFNPVAELDVVGSFYCGNDATLTGPAGTPATPGNGQFMFFNAVSGAFRAGTANGTQFDNALTGSVGIGTDVSVTSTDGFALGNDLSVTTARSMAIGFGTAGGATMTNGIAGSIMVGTTPSPSIFVSPTTVQGQTFGQVGIGTVTPNANASLDVNGPLAVQGVIVHASDARYKKDVKTIEGALEKITRLNGATYLFKEEQWPEKNFEKGTAYGFIAQDLKKVLPELVKEDQHGMLGVNYIGVIPVLVEAIKEQQAELTDRNDQLREVNEKVATLQDKLDNLTNVLTEICNNGCGNYMPTGKETVLDVKTKLFQNSPNPFTTSTAISFFIEDGVQQASIFIYNLQGEQISQVNIGTRGSGNIEIKANDLMPGQYLYSLIIDGREVDTKKMILTK